MQKISEFVWPDKKNSGNAGKEKLTLVKNCPYSPTGHCIICEEMPGGLVCNNAECWAVGVEMQSVLVGRGVWGDWEKVTEWELRNALKVGRENYRAGRCLNGSK